MSRKGNAKKAGEPSLHDDDMTLVEEFPELLLPLQQRQEKWSRRILQLTQTIDQSSGTMTYLTNQLEEREKEMRLVCEEAGLVCQLQIDEWKKKRRENYFAGGAAATTSPPPGSAGGSRGNKVASRPDSGAVNIAAATGATAAGTGTLEGVVKALSDGKKRQKLVQTLTQFFGSTPQPSNAERKGISPNAEGEREALGLPQPLPVAGGAGEEKGVEAADAAAAAAAAAAVGTTADENEVRHPDNIQKYVADEPRRPKDVPVELWQEVSLLRARRLFLSLEEIQPLKKDLEAQTKRPLLLGESYRLAVYSLEGATKVFEAAKKEAAEKKVQLEAIAAAAEGSEGSKSGSRKGRSASPQQKKQAV